MPEVHELKAPDPTAYPPDPHEEEAIQAAERDDEGCQPMAIHRIPKDAPDNVRWMII